MHRIFTLYEISDRPELLTVEDESGVPGDFLCAVGLVKLMEMISLVVKPDTYELISSKRDVWIDDKAGCLHGIPPVPQILSD